MKTAFAVLFLFVGALLAPTSAGALTYVITSSMDGAQETPAVITMGTGTMTGTYDDVTNLLTWSGTFGSLTGNTTDAHFHGPAAVGVGPAGILVAATAGSGDIFPIGVTSGAFSGTATLSAADETRLLSGLIYFNIHSSFQTGGEIRGQVFASLPEPGPLALLGLGLVGLVLRRR